MVWLLACTGGEPELEPHFDAPDSAGTFTPVTTDGLIPGSTLDLPVQLWWPSLDTDRGSIAEYDGLLTGDARTQGDVSCEAGSLPVVVFSHGNTGIRWQSIFLTERLAAHGYVVVAPDHVFNTLTDIDDERRDEIAIRRPQDVDDAFEWALEQPEVADCVDPEAGYAIIGHSFGGYTSLAISGALVDVEGLAADCETGDDEFLCDVSPYADGPWWDGSDARAWASIPLTPVGRDEFGEGLAEVAVPTLVVGGDRDDVTSMDEQILPIWEGVPDAELATVRNAGHFSFSVMCDLTSAANGCEDDMLPVEQVHELTNELTLSFLGDVRGFDAGWPPESADVTYE
ncbi:MAG: hypothetical protein GY913_27125 [Proteobacteria bacterium]|nr:hypothetical protein [Pseudomonadota bacterium]MCP4920588.1 hypothetical protein [Pseudomonadota bacterium]